MASKSAAAVVTAAVVMATLSLCLTAGSHAPLRAASAQTGGGERTVIGGGTDGAGLAARAQARPKAARTRARTRIRVVPRYPYRLESTPYPTPYDIEYPGPGAVRQCTAWLATEHRPSGTVIVPRMDCWWERG